MIVSLALAPTRSVVTFPGRGGRQAKGGLLP